jgi:hypothetical protein
MWKEISMAYFKVLPQKLTGEIKKEYLEISGSYGGEYEDCFLLGCCFV